MRMASGASIAMAMGFALLSLFGFRHLDKHLGQTLPSPPASGAIHIVPASGPQRIPALGAPAPTAATLFTFAIVSDRTGWHREGVFESAIDRLNWLSPDFVMSVGDLIEGYLPVRGLAERQWDEIEQMVSALDMPFYFVPGNHDYTNQVLADVWADRWGADHYAMRRGDVLFLCLNSEEEMRGADAGSIGEAQYQFVREQLDHHPDASHILVFMHQPLWAMDPAETGWWSDIEELLEGCPYTAFAGHAHRYMKVEKPNANCYTLSTTGGGSPLRGPEFGEFDHVAWVTMTTEGPRVVNLLLDGILPDDVRSVSTEAVLAQIQARNPVRFENQISMAALLQRPDHAEELRVQFHNHEDEPARVELHVQRDWDFDAEWTRSELRIPPNSFVTSTLRIRKKSQSHPHPSTDLSFTSTFVYEGDEAMPQLRLPMKWSVFSE